jgi:hypothetical protein
MATSEMEERISFASGPRAVLCLAPRSLDGPVSLRVLRGGSWNNNNPDNLRSANRNRNQPTNSNNNVGLPSFQHASSPEPAGSRSCRVCTGRRVGRAPAQRGPAQMVAR